MHQLMKDIPRSALGVDEWVTVWFSERDPRDEALRIAILAAKINKDHRDRLKACAKTPARRIPQDVRQTWMCDF